jgi:hypothetical protein
VRPVMLLMAGAVGILVASAEPALAQNHDTAVSFTVTAGSFDIDAPTTATLATGTRTPGGTASGTIGPVTVTDLRGSSTGWTAKVAMAGNFTAAGVPDIPSSAATYTPGAEVSHTGDGTFTAQAAGTLSSTARDVYIHAGGTGSNSLTWNPTLSVAVPNTATATTYTGTVTHSVV